VFRSRAADSEVVNNSAALSGLLRVAVFSTGVLYTSTVHDLCETSPSPEGSDPEWRAAALILVVLRLGLDALNEEYIPCLLTMLRMKHCIGILGGTPRHSIYCVGVRGDSEVMYLDPHTTQAAWTPPDRPSSSAGATASSNPTAGLLADPPELPEQYLDTFSCAYPCFDKIQRLDPSMALAFHCRNRLEFSELLGDLTTVFSATESPLFSIASVEPKYHDVVSDDDDVEAAASIGDDGGSTPSFRRSSHSAGPSQDGGLCVVDHPFVFQEDTEDFVVVHAVPPSGGDG
jgi:Peptidase family C54